MPRVTYKTRFEKLLSKDYLCRYDREFVESLFSYYARYKKMTSGRRMHLVRLEKKYENRPAISQVEEEQKALIAELVKKSGLLQDDRGREILLDFSAQISSGKSLSPRQLDLLAEKVEMYSQRNIDMAKNWLESWDSDKKLRFRIVAEYYKKSGYFKNVVRKVKSDPNYIPTFKEYNSMVNNNYSKKIIAGYYAKPKFKAGQPVTKSSNWKRYNGGVRSAGVAPGMYYSSVADNTNPVFIILEIQPISPLNACKGNKIYKILVVATGDTQYAEERELKNFKISKNRE